MFETPILLILGLLHLMSVIFSTSVLRDMRFAYGAPKRWEQLIVVIISSVILLVIVGVLAERHIRIV